MNKSILASIILAVSLVAHSVAADELSDIQKKTEVLTEFLNKHVVGLTMAKSDLVNVVNEHLLNQNVMPSFRPASALIYGGRGTGKTLLALVTAEGLQTNYTHLSMGDFAGASAIELFKEELAKALKRRSMKLLIFDDIEKADVSVQNYIGKALETGFMKFSPAPGLPEENYDISKSLFLATTSAAGELANMPLMPSVYQTEAEKAGLSYELLKQMPVLIPLKTVDLPTAYEVMRKKAGEFSEQLTDAGMNVKLNTDLLARFVVGKISAVTPREVAREPIGFVFVKSPRQVVDQGPRAISLSDIERLFGEVKNLVKRAMVLTQSRDLEVKLEKNGTSLSVSKIDTKARQLPTLFPEPSFDEMICRALFTLR